MSPGFKPLEVQRLHLHFTEYIHKTGQKLRLRQRVLATACVYYKRFYIRASLAQFDPRLVAPTLLFMASKVEESALSMKSFVQVLQSPGFLISLFFSPLLLFFDILVFLDRWGFIIDI